MGRNAKSAFALWATGHDLLKGTLAQDFHSLFLTFFCIIQSILDSKHSVANIFKNLKIRPDI